MKTTTQLISIFHNENLLLFQNSLDWGENEDAIRPEIKKKFEHVDTHT